MNAFAFRIPGEPVAKARPRLGVVNGHAMAFTPKKTRSYEDIVRQIAVREWGKQEPLAGVAITLELVFTRGIRASWPKRKQALVALGEVAPIGKPDLDNLVKACTDGMNGIVYLDDSMIVQITATKCYGLEPGVDVRMTWRAVNGAVRSKSAPVESAPLFREPLAAAPVDDHF